MTEETNANEFCPAHRSKWLILFVVVFAISQETLVLVVFSLENWDFLAL